MEFEKQKSMLLEKGNELLESVTKKSVGLGLKVNVLDDEHLRELRDWFYCAEEFTERYGLECQKESFGEYSNISNGHKVGVAQIRELLEIIKRIEQ